MQFDILAIGLPFSEGPVVRGDGSLLCVQVLAGQMTHLSAAGAVISTRQIGGGPNGLAFGPNNLCYICNNGGLDADDIARLREGEDGDAIDPGLGRIETVNLETGEVKMLYNQCDGVPLVAPNDLVFDGFGGFYFSDFGSLRRAAPQMGQVYYAQADGTGLHAVTPPLERPNGVGLSPDGTKLYVSETHSGRVWCFSLTEPGKITNAMQASALLFGDASLLMDSLAVQADGKVCVACPGNNLILRVAPDGTAERIPTVPGDPSNICFGGADMRTAYITGLHCGVVFTATWDAPGLALAFQEKWAGPSPVCGGH